MTQKAETFFKYFPCSPQSRQRGFYVISCGYSRIPAARPYPPASHPDNHNFTWEKGRVLDSYTFVYIPKGRGLFESRQSGDEQILAGSLFIVFPGVWHRYKPDALTGWDEYWVEFGGAMAENFISKSRLSPDKPVIAISGIAKVMDVFMDIMDTASNEPYGVEYLLAGQAFSLLSLTLADKSAGKNEDREKNEMIKKAKRILIDNLSQQIDLQALAEELGVSYSLFRKTFREVTGFTPHQYRLNFRLRRAGHLLGGGKTPINTIAAQLGFGSIYYFSELFKKKTGLSPLEYRKSQSCVLPDFSGD